MIDMTGTIIELQDAWKVYRMGEVEVPAPQGVSVSVIVGILAE